MPAEAEKAGNDLLSHTLSRAVQSALRVKFPRAMVVVRRGKQIPFGYAQGRLSCLASLARRNDKDLESSPLRPYSTEEPWALGKKIRVKGGGQECPPYTFTGGSPAALSLLDKNVSCIFSGDGADVCESELVEIDS
jgi:hypothetical protein